MRFLFAWQHVEPASQLIGPEGLRAVIAQLDGVELPARAWERDVLPARVERYEPSMLDMLCLTGEVAWARLSSGPTQVVGATPIALYLRANRPEAGPPAAPGYEMVSASQPCVGRPRTPAHARSLLCHGACVIACGLTEDEVRTALADWSRLER